MLTLLVLLFALGLYCYFPRIARALVGLTLGLALLAVLAVAGFAGVYYYQYRQSEASKLAAIAADLAAQQPTDQQLLQMLHAPAPSQGRDYTPELFGPPPPDKAPQKGARLRQRQTTH